MTITFPVAFSNDKSTILAVPATTAFTADWHLLYPTTIRDGIYITATTVEVMYYGALSSGHVGIHWVAVGR